MTNYFYLLYIFRESTDVDTAEQIIDSFRILAADKVQHLNCQKDIYYNDKCTIVTLY